MGAEAIFDLIVKIVAGTLVILAFKAKCYPPIKNSLERKVVKPYIDLNNRCDEFEKAQESLEIGVVAILHDRVYQACKHYLEQDSIDVEDLKNLEHLYDAYVAMGGNGTCKQLYARVCALKFKTD